jgi:hypothetical protein
MLVRESQFGRNAVKDRGSIDLIERRLTGSPQLRSGVNQRRRPALEKTGFSRVLSRAGEQKTQNSVNHSQVVTRLEVRAFFWWVLREKAVNQNVTSSLEFWMH